MNMELEFMRKIPDTNTSINYLDDTTKGFLSFSFYIFIIVGTSGNLFAIIALLHNQSLRAQAATKFVISLGTIHKPCCQRDGSIENSLLILK